MELEASLTYLIYALIFFLAFVSILLVSEKLSEKRQRGEEEEELRARLAELERIVAEKDVECYRRMQRLCGLERDAASLLDALENGEAVVVCRDGRPAAVIGGKLVCLEQAQSS